MWGVTIEMKEEKFEIRAKPWNTIPAELEALRAENYE